MEAHNNIFTGSSEFDGECKAIADWWLEYAVDRTCGGFFGQVSFDNIPDKNADKCIILQARTLWFFSEAAIGYQSVAYRKAADHAYRFIMDYFHDKEHEGFYWQVSFDGQVVDSRKHIYAQAFAVYALSAYAKLVQGTDVLSLAMECFQALVTHGKDQIHGGYCEAFAANWEKHHDARLSAKEGQHPKTMNTHLHVLEAYTGLMDALLFLKTKMSFPARWSDSVGKELHYVLSVFCERIVSKELGHIRMFMSDDWQDHSTHYSYGHDIEASWLIQKAIKCLAATNVDASEFELYVSGLARESLRSGLGSNGSMLDEVNIATSESGSTAWWVQVEAMVGFAFAWQGTNDERYLNAVQSVWEHTKSHYKDTKFGEWHWFSYLDLPFDKSEYKIGPWKGPYHAGRAMMELAKMNQGKT